MMLHQPKDGKQTKPRIFNTGAGILVTVPVKKASGFRPWLIAGAVLVCLSFLVLIIALRSGYIISNYARPVNGPMELSANFGEIRPDHWHMGIDIRTKGRENLPVRAVADGYVSRVGVSDEGYGNVIYITHSGNRTSVYAHLNEFYEPLQKLILQKQYASESWEQDVVLEPGKFPVSKGMFIALSGNTGHSGGPHLHFEWRDTKTGASLNPQTELFKLYDDLAPVIEDLYVYDRSQSGLPDALIHISNPSAKSAREIVLATSRISFGIGATDRMTSSKFTMGVYTIAVYDNDSLIYQSRRDRISDNDNREINNKIDFAAWYRNKTVTEHLYYEGVNDHGSQNSNRTGSRGIVDLADGKKHHIKIRVGDAGENFSSVEFETRYVKSNTEQSRNLPNVFAGRSSSINASNYKIRFPAGSVFRDQYFKTSWSESSDPLNLSGNISLASGEIPLRDSILVCITPLPGKETLKKQQAVLVVRNDIFYDVIAGNWVANEFKTKIANPGAIKLIVDLEPPVIGLDGWRNRDNLSALKSIKLKISDNLEKITVFSAGIDGHWVPFARRGHRFSFAFPAGFATGIHSLTVRVSDVAGNITRNTFYFAY